MIEDYSRKLCPVIEHRDLRRAILKLPTREQCNKETKSDTCSVFLDGNEETFVMFDWDERANGWRLRNDVVFTPIIAPRFPCDCGPLQPHTINKDVTKKRCNNCNKVTDLIV